MTLFYAVIILTALLGVILVVQKVANREGPSKRERKPSSKDESPRKTARQRNRV